MIRSNTVKDACDWMQSFYITAFMVKCGDLVLRPIYDLAVRQGVRPIKFGEAYDLNTETQQYEKELAEYNTQTEAQEDDDLPPLVPLSPSAWSFLNGPLHGFERMWQIEKFDYTTLTKIIIDHAAEIKQSDERPTQEQLVAAVSKIIETEMNQAESDIEYHPVANLMSGILCCNNHRWLSKDDLKKFAMAHDGSYEEVNNRTHAVEHILDCQIQLLQEVMNKNHSGNGQDSRGYDTVRAILKNNKMSMCIKSTPEDEPDRQRREEAVKNEEQSCSNKRLKIN